MRILITILLTLMMSSPALASLETCIRSCLDDITPTTPTTPTPPTGSKVFPDQIIFENNSDVAVGQYAGKALILFPASWNGKILSVGLNGETGFRDEYKGQPVFRYTKEGSAYPRPLKIVITATDGTVYTATTGASANVPSGGKKESAAPTSCGNPDGARCRQNMRFSHPGSWYGSNIKVYFDGVLALTVPNGAQRKEDLGKGRIWKPVGNNGNLVVVGDYGKRYKTCTIVW